MTEDGLGLERAAISAAVGQDARAPRRVTESDAAEVARARASGRATPQAMSPTSTPQKTSPAPEVSRTSTDGASIASDVSAVR